MTLDLRVVGDLVRLRPLEPSDVEILWQGAQDPAVTLQLGGSTPRTREQAESWVASAGATHSGRLDLAITQLEDDTMIGEIVLGDMDPIAGRARLHMWLLPEHRGRGYGREAIFRVLELAFEPAPRGLGLHRIGLRVPVTNGRARGLYESFGFKNEGQVRGYYADGDAFVDGVVMGLLVDEFDVEQGIYSPRFR